MTPSLHLAISLSILSPLPAEDLEKGDLEEKLRDVFRAIRRFVQSQAGGSWDVGAGRGDG